MADSGFNPYSNTPYNPWPQGGDPYAGIVHREKKQLRRLSSIAGLCVLGFFGLQIALSVIISVFNLNGLYNGNLLFQNTTGVFFTAICVFLPFFIAAVLMNQKDRANALLFGKPYSNALMVLALPAGFMACMAGNFVTSWLVSLAESNGVTLKSPEMPVPSDPFAIVMQIVQVAFVPALVEEYALRGVIMQPLRRFGDRFAIVMSSLVFSLMHGNMVQAPFAFIAGLTIGYFVIATGSIWTGVLIHFANNLFSVTVSLINENTGLDAEKLYIGFLTAAYIIGLSCCVFFALNRKRYRLRKPAVNIGLGERTGMYVFTFPMLCALAAIVYFTKDYVEFGG